jgi:NADPH:quinone reductase-like Zn-dependent oxidoreductase
MRAVTYASFGDPVSVLAVSELPIPAPAAGLARVKMRRAAIHNHDLWTVRGSYGQRPPLPAIGGSEAAGVVDAVGEGVTHVKPGDRVTGFGLGTWCEYFVTAAAGLVPLPDAISDDVGCQLVAMPLSAMAMLDTYRVAAPDFIVQNAANGAVGKTLAKVAKARGVNVLHLVRSEEGARELAAQGIAGAISTSSPDWFDRAKAAVGGAKILCAIDSVGGKASADICSLLSAGGKLVAFGSMSGEPMQLDTGRFIFKQITLEGFWLSKQNALPPEKSRALVAEILKLAATGVLDLPVAGVFPLERVAEAAAASARSGRGGKVLLSA